MPRKERRWQRRTQAQWRAIPQRFDSSGLGARELCRRQGLAVGSFHRWRRQLGAGAGADFVELVPASTLPAPTPGGEPAGWSLEVVLPNGACLRVRG